jgi:hypothetical protein
LVEMGRLLVADKLLRLLSLIVQRFGRVFFWFKCVCLCIVERIFYYILFHELIVWYLNERLHYIFIFRYIFFS